MIFWKSAMQRQSLKLQRTIAQMSDLCRVLSYSATI